MASKHERLGDLPPSRHVVLHVLKSADRPLTTREISERTREFGGYSQRTVQRAVDQLRHLDAVEQHRSEGPAPKPRYSVNATE